MDARTFETRIANVSAILTKQIKPLSAFIAISQDGVGWEDIYYLSGFSGTSGALAITPHDAVLFVDSRYAELAKETCVCQLMPCEAGRRITPLQAAANFVTEKSPTRVALGGRRLTHSAHNELDEIFAGNVELIDFSNVLMNMRRRKNAEEVAKIREAAGIAARAFTWALSETSAGVSEREFAARLEYMVHALGGDFANPIPVIVSSGARTSLPHAVPTRKKFDWGDWVMVDFCVRKDGYVCDITRMLSIGEPSEETKALYTLVRWAQEEAAALLSPGFDVNEIDEAARDIMVGANLGNYFTHGAGHGVGLSVHEMPSINKFSGLRLTEGDVVTLEPGFYKTGWGGMRVEDDYLVTMSGGERLTEGLSNDLFVVG
jgi:Xaa-Pro aminopeptidase